MASHPAIIKVLMIRSLWVGCRVLWVKTQKNTAKHAHFKRTYKQLWFISTTIVVTGTMGNTFYLPVFSLVMIHCTDSVKDRSFWSEASCQQWIQLHIGCYINYRDESFLAHVRMNLLLAVGRETGRPGGCGCCALSLFSNTESEEYSREGENLAPVVVRIYSSGGANRRSSWPRTAPYS